MRKQILNEEFRRMQKLAGIITEVKTDVEKKQRLEALVDFFSQSGTGDEIRAIRNTYLHFKNNKDIETLEPVLKNRYLKSPGIFNFEGFTEDEFKEIVEKLAEIKDDESFLKAPSFNENEIKRRLKEAIMVDTTIMVDPNNALMSNASDEEIDYIKANLTNVSKMPVDDFQEKYDKYMLKFYDEGDSLDTQVKALQIHIDKGILNREEAIEALATLQGQDVEEFEDIF